MQEDRSSRHRKGFVVKPWDGLTRADVKALQGEVDTLFSSKDWRTLITKRVKAAGLQVDQKPKDAAFLNLS